MPNIVLNIAFKLIFGSALIITGSKLIKSTSVKSDKN